MMRRGCLIAGLVVLALPVVCISAFVPFRLWYNWRTETPYSNPPSSLQVPDLAGFWESQYPEGGVDRLTIREDGTFKQVYRDPRESYVYETPWSEFSLERFGDGRVYVHLQEARFFERGLHAPARTSYYDPIGHTSVTMVGELILNVQATRTGELVLVHMTLSGDEGWVSMFDGRAIGFRQVKGFQ